MTDDRTIAQAEADKLAEPLNRDLNLAHRKIARHIEEPHAIDMRTISRIARRHPASRGVERDDAVELVGERGVNDEPLVGELQSGHEQVFPRQLAEALVRQGHATDGAGHEEVVAARATLDRLEALAKPQPPTPALTSAEYDVRIDGTGARVSAKYAVHAFRGGDGTVSLPLSDARLEGATVDGAPAFPTVRPDGYAIAVGAAGRHEIELRFVATVAANG